MKRLLLILMLTGCTGYDILQVEPTLTTVEGWTYAVYVKDGRVLSQLRTMAFMPNPGLVHARSIVAIRQATGCEPDPATVSGPAEGVQAILRCPK